MIKDDIQNAIFTHMKARNAVKVNALRYILSEIKNAEINKQSALTDEETIQVLQKEVKKRKEAIEMFRKAERVDLVVEEEKQVEAINEYLPKQLTEEELNKIINEELASTGPNPHIGKIIGMVMTKTKGCADGATVAQIIKQKIESPGK